MGPLHVSLYVTPDTLEGATPFLSTPAGEKGCVRFAEPVAGVYGLRLDDAFARYTTREAVFAGVLAPSAAQVADGLASATCVVLGERCERERLEGLFGRAPLPERRGNFNDGLVARAVRAVFDRVPPVPEGEPPAVRFALVCLKGDSRQAVDLLRNISPAPGQQDAWGVGDFCGGRYIAARSAGEVAASLNKVLQSPSLQRLSPGLTLAFDLAVQSRGGGTQHLCIIDFAQAHLAGHDVVGSLPRWVTGGGGAADAPAPLAAALRRGGAVAVALQHPRHYAPPLTAAVADLAAALRPTLSAPAPAAGRAAEPSATSDGLHFACLASSPRSPRSPGPYAGFTHSPPAPHRSPPPGHRSPPRLRRAAGASPGVAGAFAEIGSGEAAREAVRARRHAAHCQQQMEFAEAEAFKLRAVVADLQGQLDAASANRREGERDRARAAAQLADADARIEHLQRQLLDAEERLDAAAAEARRESATDRAAAEAQLRSAVERARDAEHAAERDAESLRTQLGELTRSLRAAEEARERDQQLLREAAARREEETERLRQRARDLQSREQQLRDRERALAAEEARLGEDYESRMRQREGQLQRQHELQLATEQSARRRAIADTEAELELVRSQMQAREAELQEEMNTLQERLRAQSLQLETRDREAARLRASLRDGEDQGAHAAALRAELEQAREDSAQQLRDAEHAAAQQQREAAAALQAARRQWKEELDNAARQVSLRDEALRKAEDDLAAAEQRWQLELDAERERAAEERAALREGHAQQLSDVEAAAAEAAQQAARARSELASVQADALRHQRLAEQKTLELQGLQRLAAEAGEVRTRNAELERMMRESHEYGRMQQLRGDFEDAFDQLELLRQRLIGGWCADWRRLGRWRDLCKHLLLRAEELSARVREAETEEREQRVREVALVGEHETACSRLAEQTRRAAALEARSAELEREAQAVRDEAQQAGGEVAALRQVVESLAAILVTTSGGAPGLAEGWAAGADVEGWLVGALRELKADRARLRDVHADCQHELSELRMRHSQLQAENDVINAKVKEMSNQIIGYSSSAPWFRSGQAAPPAAPPGTASPGRAKSPPRSSAVGDAACGERPQSPVQQAEAAYLAALRRLGQASGGPPPAALSPRCGAAPPSGGASVLSPASAASRRLAQQRLLPPPPVPYNSPCGAGERALRDAVQTPSRPGGSTPRYGGLNAPPAPANLRQPPPHSPPVPDALRLTLAAGPGQHLAGAAPPG